MESAIFAKTSQINIVDIPIGSLQFNFHAFCMNGSFRASVFAKGVNFQAATTFVLFHIAIQAW